MTIEKYIEEIDKDGLENVWDSIIKNGLSEVQNAGELYEIGLAHINKKEKKESGNGDMYSVYWQFSLKKPWLLPKYEPEFGESKIPLYGWLFFYFGRKKEHLFA